MGYNYHVNDWTDLVVPCLAPLLFIGAFLLANRIAESVTKNSGRERQHSHEWIVWAIVIIILFFLAPQLFGMK